MWTTPLSLSRPRWSYSRTPRGYVARFFGLKDEATSTFVTEIVGGVSMFLVTAYMFEEGATSQTSPRCPIVNTNGTRPTLRPPPQDVRALASSYAVAMGVGTILMGLLGGAPIVIGPGVGFAKAFACLRASIPPSNALASNLIVGLLLFPFALTSRQFRVYDAMNEDFRLGLGAGIGALLIRIALELTVVNWSRESAFSSFMAPLSNGATGATGGSSFNGQGALVLVSFVVAASMFAYARARPFALIASVAVGVLVVEVGRVVSGWVPPAVSLPQSPATAPGVSFADIGGGYKSGIVLSYVALMWVEKVFNTAATLSALILLQVSHRMGYTRETFLRVLNDSRKMSNMLLVDCLVNVVVSPFLGVAITTPYIESAAGIVLGAKTGLASVVAGCLFLLMTPVATPASLVLGLQVSAGALVFSCIAIVVSLRFVSTKAVDEYAPAFLVFFLVAVTGSIGYGASLAFIFTFLIKVLVGHANLVTRPRPLSMMILSVMFVALALEQENFKSPDSNSKNVTIITVVVCLGVLTLTMVAFALVEGRSAFDPVGGWSSSAEGAGGLGGSASSSNFLRGLGHSTYGPAWGQSEGAAPTTAAPAPSAGVERAASGSGGGGGGGGRRTGSISMVFPPLWRRSASDGGGGHASAAGGLGGLGAFDGSAPAPASPEPSRRRTQSRASGSRSRGAWISYSPTSSLLNSRSTRRSATRTTGDISSLTSPSSSAAGGTRGGGFTLTSLTSQASSAALVQSTVDASAHPVSSGAGPAAAAAPSASSTPPLPTAPTPPSVPHEPSADAGAPPSARDLAVV